MLLAHPTAHNISTESERVFSHKISSPGYVVKSNIIFSDTQTHKHIRKVRYDTEK